MENARPLAHQSAAMQLFARDAADAVEIHAAGQDAQINYLQNAVSRLLTTLQFERV